MAEEKRCWCGGEVGPRTPGDVAGLGCLADITHDWAWACRTCEDTLEWTAALRHPDGSLEPVGVAHCDDVNPRAQSEVMDHVYAWRRDAPDEDVVLLRRSVGRWVVCSGE